MEHEDPHTDILESLREGLERIKEIRESKISEKSIEIITAHWNTLRRFLIGSDNYSEISLENAVVYAHHPHKEQPFLQGYGEDESEEIDDSRPAGHHYLILTRDEDPNLRYRVVFSENVPGLYLHNEVAKIKSKILSQDRREEIALERLAQEAFRISRETPLHQSRKINYPSLRDLAHTLTIVSAVGGSAFGVLWYLSRNYIIASTCAATAITTAGLVLARELCSNRMNAENNKNKEPIVYAGLEALEVFTNTILARSSKSNPE